MTQAIPLHGQLVAAGKRLPTPFVAKRHAGLFHVESKADARFRNYLLELAPTKAIRAHMLEGLRNGPKGDRGAHARRYFGEDGIAGISAHIDPLTQAIDLLLATRAGLPGFRDWLNISDFGNDYRILKGFIAWADTAKSQELPKTEEPTNADQVGIQDVS